MELFYMQDSRQYVGNDVLWWALDGKGYTTDLSKAQIYTKEEAQSLHNNRRTDVPWPKNYIDQKTRPAVDMQYIRHDEALAGTGIAITPEPKKKREQLSCIGCGRFLRAGDFWAGHCQHCGADNMP